MHFVDSATLGMNTIPLYRNIFLHGEQSLSCADVFVEMKVEWFRVRKEIKVYLAIQPAVCTKTFLSARSKTQNVL